MNFCSSLIGVLQAALTNSFIYNARQQLGETMQISPLQLQDLRVESDMADVYILATLLDRTSPTGKCQDSRKIDFHLLTFLCQ